MLGHICPRYSFRFVGESLVRLAGQPLLLQCEARNRFKSSSSISVGRGASFRRRLSSIRSPQWLQAKAKIKAMTVIRTKIHDGILYSKYWLQIWKEQVYRRGFDPERVVTTGFNGMTNGSSQLSTLECNGLYLETWPTRCPKYQIPESLLYIQVTLPSKILCMWSLSLAVGWHVLRQPLSAGTLLWRADTAGHL